MDYYRCSIDELRRELKRRDLPLVGSSDQLSETLKRDDNARGADATTVSTQDLGPYVPQAIHQSRTAEYGKSVPAFSLVQERIIYWSMNSFFPSLQLFFESGRSCTIESGQHPNAIIGLDDELRFRLTDCTHEEDGRLTKTTRPDKFAHVKPGILIKEAMIAQRTSIAVKAAVHDQASGLRAPIVPATTIEHETYIVIGLRLEGMRHMGYIWAKSQGPGSSDHKTWGHVRIAGLRSDAPAPSLALLLQGVKPGGQVVLTAKESLINRGVSNGGV